MHSALFCHFEFAFLFGSVSPSKCYQMWGSIGNFFVRILKPQVVGFIFMLHCSFGASVIHRSAVLYYFYCDKHNGWNTLNPANLNIAGEVIFCSLFSLLDSSTLLAVDSSLFSRSILHYNKVKIFILSTSPMPRLLPHVLQSHLFLQRLRKGSEVKTQKWSEINALKISCSLCGKIVC